MKLLTRLRELRNKNTDDKLFDNFHFSADLSPAELMPHDAVMGIGATAYEDIHRLSIENNNFNKL